MKVEIEIDGEPEHHFEYLLENAEREDGGEVTPEWLAEHLLSQKATEQYFKALRGGQPSPK